MVNLPQRYSFSLLALVAANLVPLIGVFLFGWSAYALLILYWLESVVFGILNVPKILACRNPNVSGVIGILGAVYTAVFFCVHFGAFSYAHGLIVFNLFGGLEALQNLQSADPAQQLSQIDIDAVGRRKFGVEAFMQAGLLWAAASFAASHIFSMFYNFFGKKEYLARTPQQQMSVPYKRVLVMHFVILIAGGLMARFQTPMLALVLLVTLKTLIDLGAHLKEHRRQGSGASD